LAIALAAEGLSVVTSRGFWVAVRDLIMPVAAFTLARLTLVHEAAAQAESHLVEARHVA